MPQPKPDGFEPTPTDKPQPTPNPEPKPNPQPEPKTAPQPQPKPDGFEPSGADSDSDGFEMVSAPTPVAQKARKRKCTHERLTKTGSNQYAQQIKCRDCGKVLHKDFFDSPLAKKTPTGKG